MRNKFTTLFTAFVLSSLSVVALAQDATEQSAIDPKISEILKSGCGYLNSGDHYRMELYDTIDEVMDDGQKIQYAHHRIITVSRPDQFYILSEGDRTNRKTWRDKSGVTFYDYKKDFYAILPFEGTNGALIDHLMDEYDASMPLADFVGEGTFERFTENVTKASYIGLGYVHGFECHHLAFQQEDIDWQIWIENDSTPLIRKLVISYIDIPESPQYTMILKEFALLDHVPEGLFTADVPEDATLIELVPAGEREADVEMDGEEGHDEEGHDEDGEEEEGEES